MLAKVSIREETRRVNVRSAKEATQRRVSRAARARYAALLRFCFGLALALGCFLLYVTLTARITSLNYAIGRAERERLTLQAQTNRLDDEIAQLRSDERLARVAEQLHMQEPQQFAIVLLPPPAAKRDRSHLAFLSGLTTLFGVK